MTWQDLVLAAGGFVIVASLVPTLRNAAARVPLSTSVTLGTVLTIYVGTFASLGLWLAAAGTAAQVGCWAFIAARRRV